MSRVESKYISKYNINQSYINFESYFKKSFEDRKINNLYFDTLDEKFYRDHVEGSYSRHKVRVRWYDQFFNRSLKIKNNYFLEIKLKEKGKIYKYKIKLENFKTSNFDLDYINYEYVKLLQKENLKIKFSSLFPRLQNSYMRKYYIISSNKDNRITLDYDLKFMDLNINSYLSKSEKNVNFNILEHKYLESNNKNLKIKHLCFKKTGFSKYIYGLNMFKGI